MLIEKQSVAGKDNRSLYLTLAGISIQGINDPLIKDTTLYQDPEDPYHSVLTIDSPTGEKLVIKLMDRRRINAGICTDNIENFDDWELKLESIDSENYHYYVNRVLHRDDVEVWLS